MPAPIIVQHKSAVGLQVTSGANTACTFTSNVTPGNMVLVFVGTAHDNSGVAITINTPTMTGETFSTWTGAPDPGTTGNGQSGVFATNTAVGGQKIVNVSLTFSSATPDIHIHVIEISGQSSSPRDAQGHTNSATASVSTSGATTNPNDLVFGFFYDDANNASLTVGGGYSLVELSTDATFGDAALSESKTVSSTGTQTATCGGNGTDILSQSIVVVGGAAGGTILWSQLRTSGPSWAI